MADKILLSGISCSACIGVTEQERATPQPVLADLILWLDLEAAANTDDLSLTVDYHQVLNSARDTIEKSRFKLLETLAREVCRTVLANRRIQSVQVTLTKYPAALKPKVAQVAVEIKRDHQ